MPKESRKRKGDWDDFFDLFGEDFGEARERMDRILEEFMSGRLGEGNPLVYGFSMRVGPDGQPVVQEFGSALPRNEDEAKEPAREPLTDIIEAEDKVTVVMELPGVDKEDIKVDASDRSLDLSVDTAAKRLSKHLSLPCDVVGNSAEASYKNGVLQVVLRRASPKKKAKHIKVE